MVYDDLLGHIYDKVFNEDISIYLVEEFTDDLCCSHCDSEKISKNGLTNLVNKDITVITMSANIKHFVYVPILFYYSKHSKEQWLIFIRCLPNKDSTKKTASKVGTNEKTVTYWRHKTMYILNKLYNSEVTDSKAYFDDTLFTDTAKGVEKLEESCLKKRRVSNDKINVSCIIDEYKQSILKVTDTERVKAQTLINEFKGGITPKIIVVSDNEESYHKFMKAIEAKWHKIPSSKSSYKGESLETINNLHSLL